MNEHECEYKSHVEVLEKRVTELEGQVCALLKELEQYRKPPKNSGNSSIPPSRDPNRKFFPKREKTQRKSGAQEGHAGHHHAFVDDPDVINSTLRLVNTVVQENSYVWRHMGNLVRKWIFLLSNPL